jgi:hypothetical protein
MLLVWSTMLLKMGIGSIVWELGIYSKYFVSISLGEGIT